MDRADDRLLALYELEDAGRHEPTALDRFADLAVFLDEGDVIPGGGHFAREVPPGRARADHDDIEGARRGDHVRHHSFRFMMISRKFSRCFERDALSV